MCAAVFASKFYSGGGNFNHLKEAIGERLIMDPTTMYKAVGLFPLAFSHQSASQNNAISNDEHEQIRNVLYENKELNDSFVLPPQITPKRNVVIILMESFNTSCITPKVMPTLYSLSTESTTLYCPNTNSLTQGAVSIGGQLVVLSGLHGLMNTPFCMQYPYNCYPSISKELKSAYKNSYSFVSVSSDKFFWRQHEVSDALGFDEVWGLTDSVTNLNKHKWADDKVVFDVALSKIPNDSTAFCFVIVPSNMHSPYYIDDKIEYEASFDGVDATTAEYFRRAKYCDEQVRSFIYGLKNKGKYDDTLIVITSDHQIPFVYCSKEMMSHLSPYFPTLFVNTGVNWCEKNKQNEDVVFCQSQIYPTMLQLMGLKPMEYFGLFPAMTNVDETREYEFENCSYSITENAKLKMIYHLQEKMISNSYFGRRSIKN